MQEKDTKKRGLWGLIAMLVLTVLVVVLSGPIYNWLTGAGKGETYTATKNGYGGDVTVTLTVDEGIVRQLKAEGPMETPAIGGKALTEYNEEFAGEKGDELIDLDLDLDAVSGATVTSRAVQEALLDAAAQAGLVVPETDAQQETNIQPETDEHTTATP